MMFNDTVNNISIILWQIFFLLYRFLHMTVNKNQQKYSLPSTIKHYLYVCTNESYVQFMYRKFNNTRIQSCVHLNEIINVTIFDLMCMIS